MRVGGWTRGRTEIEDKKRHQSAGRKRKEIEDGGQMNGRGSGWRGGSVVSDEDGEEEGGREGQREGAGSSVLHSTH